jgi:hypothetical protein
MVSATALSETSLNTLADARPALNAAMPDNRACGRGMLPIGSVGIGICIHLRYWAVRRRERAGRVSLAAAKLARPDKDGAL